MEKKEAGMLTAILIILIINTAATAAAAYIAMKAARQTKTAQTARTEPKQEANGLEREVENLMNYDGGRK